jgi:hypothetical protein
MERMRDNLHILFLSRDATVDFTTILTRMAGFLEKPVIVSSTQVMEETSRVRNLHQEIT